MLSRDKKEKRTMDRHPTEDLAGEGEQVPESTTRFALLTCNIDQTCHSRSLTGISE